MKQFFLVVLFIFSFAKDITIEFIDTLPYSIAKDYYIWRFLDQNIDSIQADRAFYQIKNMNNKLLYKYAQKSSNKDVVKSIECMQFKAIHYTKESDIDCIITGLTPIKAKQLTSSELKSIATKVKLKYPYYAKMYQTIASKLPFSKMILEDEKLFFDIFNKIGTSYRVKHLNFKLPQKYIDRLIKYPNFNTTVKIITTDLKLDRLQKSILDIDSSSLDHFSNFFLALNALRYNKKTLALNYLKIAKKKAWYRFDLDKVIFWQYQITNNKKYLQELEESFDVNFYTLFANSINKTKPKNIITQIKIKHSATDFNEMNPFEWLQELEKSKELDYERLQYFEDKFSSIETTAHLALMYEKYSKSKNHYFIQPYTKQLKGQSVHTKALIYALSYQESRFIPTSISSSYAMGVMQFMPFLTRAISKEKKKKLNDLDDILNVDLSIEYALHHLKFLEHRLNHVLFIAYAYNGGIGFTRRMLNRGTFTTTKKYEPYISMELMSNSESRKYGKKVLANYIVYRDILGDSVDFNKIISDIKSLQ